MPHPELNGTVEQNGHADGRIGLSQLAAMLGVNIDDGTPADAVDVTEGMPVRLVAPPDDVWARIAATTGVLVDARPELVRSTAETAQVSQLAPDLATPVELATIKEFRRSERKPQRDPARSPAGSPALDPAHADRSRRLEPLLTFVAAATLVVGVLAGAGSVFAFQHWGDDQGATVAAEPVLGRAALSPLPDAPAAAGDVDMVRTPTGMQLQVSVRRLARPDGFYEVWLADTSLDKMIPVGLMQGDTATFDLPPDLDPSGYPTVDISLEPIDGNPAHSAHSVLRGTLRA